MHENKFNIIEGKVMLLEALKLEIQEITGITVTNLDTLKSRVVAQKPAPDQHFETFNMRFDFDESEDYVDVVFTTDKKTRIEDYDFESDEVKVQLLSYRRVDAPQDNGSEKVEE